jgi:hypothetical protein
MSWSVVPFGRYSGKTLPEIIVADVDWFFWVLPKLYGKLGTEARDLARKARAIKIPKAQRRECEVEYRFDVDNRFCGFAFVKTESWHSRWTIRLPHLDLAWPPLFGARVEAWTTKRSANGRERCGLPIVPKSPTVA